MRTLLSNGKAACGVVMVVITVVIAMLGRSSSAIRTPSWGALQPPSLDHWLGTTVAGQTTQTVAGARPTLIVAAAVGLGVTIIGAFVGAYGAFRGGRVDDVLSLITNVFLVLPGLPLMVVIAAWAPPGPITIASVLIVTGWAWPARIIRRRTSSFETRPTSRRPSWRETLR